MTTLHPALVAVWRAIRPSLSDAEAREVMAARREPGAIDTRERARSFAVLIRPDDPDAAHRAILAALSDWLRAQAPELLAAACPGCKACARFDDGHFASRFEALVAAAGSPELGWCCLQLIEETRESLDAADIASIPRMLRSLDAFARDPSSETQAALCAAGQLYDGVFDAGGRIEMKGAEDIADALYAVAESVRLTIELEAGSAVPPMLWLVGADPHPLSPALLVARAQWGYELAPEQAAIIRDLFADALLSFPMPTERRGDPSRHDH